MLRTTRRLNMVTISMKYFQNQTLKKRSYGLDTILLLGHAVTLTFKVATQILLATRCLNMMIISVKLF